MESEMKYSVQQIEQALKGGRIIQYTASQNEHFSCRYDAYSRQVTISTEHLILGHIVLNVDLKFLLKCFDLNIYNCTKIEGEETMEKKTPHKHAELIKKWADTGCQIQYNVHALAIWIDCVRNNPSWEPDIEYRVKPTLVKKWKWVLTNKSGEGTFFELTPSYYANEEDWVKAVGTSNPWKLHQKIDSTMIEVEE